MEKFKELISKYPNAYKLGNACREYIVVNNIEEYMYLVKAYPNDFNLANRVRKLFSE